MADLSLMVGISQIKIFQAMESEAGGGLTKTIILLQEKELTEQMLIQFLPINDFYHIMRIQFL